MKIPDLTYKQKVIASVIYQVITSFVIGILAARMNGGFHVPFYLIFAMIFQVYCLMRSMHKRHIKHLNAMHAAERGIILVNWGVTVAALEEALIANKAMSKSALGLPVIRPPHGSQWN